MTIPHKKSAEGDQDTASVTQGKSKLMGIERLVPQDRYGKALGLHDFTYSAPMSDSVRWAFANKGV